MEKRYYEVLVAFEPAVAAADGEALLSRLHAVITDAKGEIRSIEKLGVRRLAFRVKGRTEANFVLLTTYMPVTTVPAVEQVLRMHEGVIRYMTTRLDPSLLMPSQGAPAPQTGRGAPADAGSPAPVAAPTPVTPPAPAA
ncbi:MAG: 30S ribosomal protein S6 [Candidatus Coatesbacteria bacterium]